jgi:hypothetical protein
LNLSEEQILALAPDESSKKSGKDLANPSKWVTKAFNDAALWGECQGSGSKPYQTQIDINNIAFKCSCPSRKFPCKHGLGLLLLYARQKNSFSASDAPAWVSEWLAKRTEKQEKQVEKKDKPVDEVAQAKRQQARQLKVSDGIEELKVWVKDIVRNGILNMPEKGEAYFLNMAKRMVDAQAPGLAGMIRGLAETNFYAEGWQTKFMDQLLRIYMIAEAYGNINSLNDSLQQDIRTWIGFTQNQEELKEQNGIVDTWLVLGKQITEEDTITTERNWLYGVNTNSYALVLQFIIRGQGAQLALTPGLFVQAELVFFPSLSPLRAIIKRQITTNAVTAFKGFANWNEVAQTETILNAALPFRSERPFILHQLKPVNYNGQWWLQDTQQKMMQLRNEYKTIWKILAVSGGEPVDMAVIGREDNYEPVGIWYNDEYKIL